jgi:membrane protease subunit HflC
MRIQNLKRCYSAAAGVAVILSLWLSFYSVRENESVLVMEFGKPLYTVTRAGMHAKWFFQTTNYFDRRLRIYSPRPSEFLTRDKKNLVVDVYVAWKIDDPKRFVETVGDPTAAEMRLHDVVWAGLSATLGAHDLDAFISKTGKTAGAREVMDGLADTADRAALTQYGIQAVDVRIKRINLPEQNKQSVYARMRAERDRIARQYRAEGEEQALKVRADADRQREEILSMAYQRAEKTRGEGDAESTRIYGRAYSRDLRFYRLFRTLESYRKIFDDKTTAILGSDSELLKILMDGEKGAK